MKLFNKTIDRQLFKQYALGSNLAKQEVVVKIFNPYSNGTWFILNSDPQDPDYLWAIVDLGYGAEVGSVSRSELENYRGRFGLGFERDLGFDPINAEELYQGLRNGEYYADGGDVQGKDTWQNIFEEFGFKKGRSMYGLDMYYKRGYIGSVDHELRNVELMFEDDVIYKGFSIQGLLSELENQFGKRNFADGGNIQENKPYVFYFYYDGNEMTFNTLEKALKEAKQYGVNKVRDDLGGEYFLNFADGGDISDYSDNQQMIMNQNVEVEHHHEELEDILEDEIPVPAWVVAKMATATQNLSDITHYLDGEKELMEDEMEDENEEEDEDQDEIENKIVVEPIDVSAGTKTDLTKKFTDDAMGNLRGFLKGMEGVDLRDDYTFDYKDEQYEVEPIINSDENGVSNAVFTIFDGDGEEVGEVAYSREGGKQKFTANSEFFSWNNAKFEDGGFMNNVYADGGYFDGAIPNVSTYMSTYAKGGEVEQTQYVLFKTEKDLSKITNVLNEYDGHVNESDRIRNRNKLYHNVDGKKIIVFSNLSVDMILDLARNYGAEIEKYSKENYDNYAKGGEVAKAEILGLKRNIMGTTSIEMKISGMRKPQVFSVYPIGKDDIDKIITIQSDTRIGKIDLGSGRGLMSQSHSNGAYFVHFQMDKLTPFTISESDLEDLKMHIFKTAGDNVGSRGIVSDNSGASRIFAKGGEMNIKDLTNIEVYDEVKSKVGNSVWEQNALNILRNESLKNPNSKFNPTGDSEKLTKYLSNISSYANGGGIEKVRWQEVEIGDSARVKELNRLGLIVHTYGRKFHLKFPNGTEKTFDASELEFFKLEKDEYEMDDNNNFAKGGMVVTSVKDIPNFKERLEQRRITYRGLGMGKVADDFYKLAGTSGTRIKVDGKEYFITDEEFDTFSRDADGKMQIRFDAPARKRYADGGKTNKILYSLDQIEYDVEYRDKNGEKYSEIFNTKDEALKEIYRLEKLGFIITSRKRSFKDDGTFNGFFADGGETEEGVDLFEDYDNIPPKLQAVLDKYEYAFQDGDYRDLEKALKAVNAIGYTFEYYLDGQAYDLRKIGQKGKSEVEEYAKGGSVKKDWWNTVVNPNEDFHNYDNRKPIDWDVDDFKSWVVSNSDLDGNVDKEVLDVVKMPKSKLTVEYLNKNGSGKNNNEYYKEFGNWQSALYDIFTQLKKDYLFKKERKYILKSDIKTVTVKRKGKEVTYNGSDVLNGAYVLAKGGDITSKANYVGKNDVVEVELKDGSKIKPVNGYWIKKGAEPISNEPTPTTSAKSGSKVGETYIRKDMRGNWKAETNVDDFNGYDWRISTIKTYSGNLVSSAQGGKTESTGTKGIVMFKYTMYEDPNYTLEVSTPKRLTEKLVTEQHEKALAKFKKFMETGNFGKGGKISNFDKLSAKVSKQYEGKPVKSQYQEEYGKYYSKEEAQEVGDKVAGKMKAITADKKESGGRISMKLANELAKEIRKDGESWNDAKKRAFAQLKK